MYQSSLPPGGIRPFRSHCKYHVRSHCAGRSAPEIQHHCNGAGQTLFLAPSLTTRFSTIGNGAEPKFSPNTLTVFGENLLGRRAHFQAHQKLNSMILLGLSLANLIAQHRPRPIRTLQRSSNKNSNRLPLLRSSRKSPYTRARDPATCPIWACHLDLVCVAQVEAHPYAGTSPFLLEEETVRIL